ncbi:P-loop containing nucleoside triphosphate hydrolase protein [Lenzites betulinus]|nr:P-loop containing nucleoside triphosphate hydrolase protein [Lenzites betulinus]
MTLDVHTPGPSDHKHKKSKKSKHEHQAVRDDALGEVGTSDAAGKIKKSKKKKDANAATSSDANGAASGAEVVDETMAVDVADVDPPTDKKSKKKRKRETGEGGAGEAGPSESKKEKKKRKQDVQSVHGETEQQKTFETQSPKEKKHKKEMKSKDTVSVVDERPVLSIKSTAAPSTSDVQSFLKKHEVTLHIPDSVPQYVPILTFDQLDVPAELRAAFDGFKEPTPIQACSWPPALDGRDVVGIAETGSGKTLAFGLPALARILQAVSQDPKKQKGTTVSVLVVAPTRELAIQTHETLEALGAPFGIASVAVFGGVDKAPQVRTLKNANKDGKTTRVIVGTPGRILDLVNDGACDLSKVSYLVLDEADRMLDRGFENDIRAIIGHTIQGAGRQTLMFSATWPDAVRRLASTFQRDPIRVTVGSDDLTANSRVEQVVEVFDEPRSKDSRLLDRLRTLLPKNSKGNPEDARILIFALYKKEATRVEGMLKSKGFSVMGLHGDMSQSARMDALQRFKSGVATLLVATDVAARGLDIPNVAAVINYTFPLTIEDYIHRIGRTGRGGNTGKSITFFTGENHERALAGELARVLRESGFETEALHKFPMTIKKKEHSAYGAFFRDDIPAPKGPTKIKF